MTNVARQFREQEEAAGTSWSGRFSEKRTSVDDPSIREILQVATKPGILSMAGGLPHPALLPLREISQITQDVVNDATYAAAQYGVTEGFYPLREELSRRAVSDRRPCEAKNVMVTTGGQQALDLIAQVFMNQGDSIAVTRPCYLGALQIFSAYQPKWVEVASDSDGPVLAEVEAALRQRPKFFYVVSAFDNPSGASVSRERGEAIVRMCHEFNVPIIEDGTYRELYHNKRQDSLREIEGEFLATRNQTYDCTGKVLFAGTMSKVMAPGFRIGWIEAPSEVIEGLAILKQSVDLHSSNLTQMVACEFLKRCSAEVWPKLREAYRKKCAIAQEAVRTRMGSEVVTCNEPKGGFFLWIEVDPRFDTSQMLVNAVRDYGVAYVPGAPFFALNPRHNFMRVSYSNVADERIEEGIERISRAFREGRAAPR